MSIQEVAPEELARLFHHYHHALAPDFHCSREANVETWEQVPAAERNRLVAAARLTLLELSTSGELRTAKKYFAKPGEAEWGC